MPYHSPIPDPHPRGKASSLVDGIVQAEKLIQIVLVLPCAGLIGWLIGAFLDEKLHRSWITVVGVLFGILCGLVAVIRYALTFSSRSDDGDKSDDKGKTA